jgi:integrase
MPDIKRASQPRRVPVVLTPDEVRRLLARLEDPDRQVVSLVYGSGLRILECVRKRRSRVLVCSSMRPGQSRFS